MKHYGIPWILVLLVQLNYSNGDSFSKLGCFSKSSIQGVLSYKDEYIYQSSSHCETECAGKKVAALLNGKYCYCGDSEPDLSDETDSSDCNVSCQGYGQENCGGSNAFLVYSNSDVESESTSSSSSSTSSSSTSTSTSSTSTSSSTSSTSSSTSTSTSTSTTSSSSSSSSTSTSTSTSSTDTSSSTTSSSSSSSQLSSSSASSSIFPSRTDYSSSSSLSSSLTKVQGTTLISTITTNPTGTQEASTIAITTTERPSSTANADNKNDDKSSSKSISTGGIVGAVIGSVAGAGIIAGLLLFFCCYKRNKQDDDRDDEFTLSGPSNEKTATFDGAPNPFMIPQGAHNDDRAMDPHNKDSLHSVESTNNEDYYMPLGHPEFESPGVNKLSSEYGRRRLSDGSLPDMVTRNPGSLKVVNN